MSDLINLNIKEAKKLLKKREISAVELTEAFLDRARSCSDLNAFVLLTPDIALKQASAADEKYKNATEGIIEGIPLGIKDIFCTKGIETTACSRILEGYKPEYESTVTGKLLNEGAVFMGKTNMDEFAMGSSNITSSKGPVKSPWKRKTDNKDLVPGGSSGGSAAAVSAKLCMAATGTDTGGSIRQPASFSGIVGVKPTYGRCSRYGIIAYASSLDQAGIFTQTVEDSALLLQVICGHDAKDSTSSPIEVPDFSKEIGKNLKGLRVGIPKEYKAEGLPKDIEDIWQKGMDYLKGEGAEIVNISLPHTKYALPVYYIVACAEASSNLARYDGVRYGKRVIGENGSIDEMYKATRSYGFGEEVKRRIIMGAYVLSAGHYDAHYTKAQKVRRKITNDFLTAFKEVDLILTPTAPSSAFAIDEKEEDPIKMYLNDVFTVPVNLAGLPAISIPACLTDNGLPLGLQLISRHFDEITLFKAAHALEKAAGFKGL
jgi:aspartyl-tRNA(Asn)/glutamyl-tRNA(Gln) amidotransferase subunit A